MPDDAKDTEGAHSIAHSIRLHGAVGDPVGSQLRAEKAAPVREFGGFAGVGGGRRVSQQRESV